MTDNLSASPSEVSTFDELKLSILGSIALAIVGLSAGGFSILQHQQQISAEKQAHDRLTQSRREIGNLLTQIEQSNQALPGFERLRAKGSIGLLNKTVQADRFEEISRDHPANVSTFSLGALQYLPEAPGLPMTGLSLGRHQLTFKANPSHEMHLLALLADVERDLGGLTLLNQCKINRSSLGGETGNKLEKDKAKLLSEGLQAQCTFDTYLFNQEGDSPFGADGMPPLGETL